MTISELLAYGKSQIHSDQSRILLADTMNLSPLELYNYLDKEVELKKELLFKKKVEAVKNKQPLQYVVGHVNFYGLKYIVNKNVLIPRFETELLVEKTLEYINENFKEKSLSIIDLGTGSGVIGLTIKKRCPNSKVTLVDISNEALEVARANAQNLNLEVDFIESDMFAEVKNKYDVIISNPPYIAHDEIVEDIVKNNEPHLALFAEDNGMRCYEKILKEIKKHTKEKYLLAFEIGCDQKELMLSLIDKYLENVKVKVEKDLAGRNRMVFVFHNLV